MGITSPIGCYTERNFPYLIKVDSFPEADFYFGPDRITNFLPEVNFFDNSLRDYKWEWDFAGQGFSYEENPSFSFPDTGNQIIELIVTTEAGCQDTVQKIVDVIPEVRYFLPNAFTPNGDGKNDEFKTKFRQDSFHFDDYSLQIFNRWGEMMFESSDPNEGWDGTLNGVQQQQDVFVYIVRYTKMHTTKVIERVGTVNLIR